MRALLRTASIGSLVLLTAGCISAPPVAGDTASTALPLPSVATVPAFSTSIPDPVPVTSTTAPSIDNELLGEARSWAFRVRSVDCLATGSSFAVASGIVTNRHVASGSDTLEMSTWDGTDFDALVSAVSSGPDLALLSNAGAPRGTATAPLSPANPAVGTAVWAAGYPEGNQLTVTPGQILAYVDGSVVGIQNQVMEISNAIEPGNSGSALLNSSGDVVGVVFAIRLSNNDGLAIPISELSSFLASPGSQLVPTCAG